MPQQNFPPYGKIDEHAFVSISRHYETNTHRIFVTNGKGDSVKIHVDDAFIDRLREALRKYALPTMGIVEVDTPYQMPPTKESAKC
jgi:hypothetical protein